MPEREERNGGEDVPDAPRSRPLPRPRDFDDVYELVRQLDARIAHLDSRIQIVVQGQVDQATQIGRVVSAVSSVETSIANLRASLEPGGPIEARVAQKSAHDLEPLVRQVERKADQIQQAAHDIQETAEEMTNPGVEPRKSDSDRAKALVDAVDLRRLRNREKWLMGIIAGVLVLMLAGMIMRAMHVPVP